MALCIKAETIEDGFRIAGEFHWGDDAIDSVVNVYKRYGRWIEQYRGAIPPLYAAFGIRHESHGDPLHTSDPVIKESGLWSLLPGFCRKHNIDPFDPEANVWGASYLRNARIKMIMDDPQYNWIAGSDPYDWTQLAVLLHGGIGFGGWKAVMDMVFPTLPPPRSHARRFPYDYIRQWMERNADSVPKLGRMRPALVICRVMRDANIEFMARLGQVAVPGKYRMIPRPTHLRPWNEPIFHLVWATPKTERSGRFPQYLRSAPTTIVPEIIPYKRGSGIRKKRRFPWIAGLSLGLAGSALAYAVHKGRSR